MCVPLLSNLPSCCRLTEAEKKKTQYKRKMLSLAREHNDARKSEKVDRYYIPADDVVSSP